MAKSRWEKYVVRRPIRYIWNADHTQTVGEEVPKSIPIHDNWGPYDTGVQIPISPLLIPEAYSIVEYGFIYGDCVNATKPHKHMDYDEMFIFGGTNPEDVSDLGGEVEFWIGEDDTAEGIVFKESGAIYVPRGTGHFPQIFRHVKRPILEIVVMPTTKKRSLTPVSNKNRPVFK